MSGKDDCASQEIEASTSPNSTRSIEKCTFVRSILRVDDSQRICSPDLRIILPADRVPRLPQLEKRDFIQNWIIAHSNSANSPVKSDPGSPILGISPEKRSPQSPILGYRWKRVKRETSSKENCRVSLSKKFQRVPDSPLKPRIKIETEDLQFSEIRDTDFLNNDTDKTLIGPNSPVLNGIVNSPVLNGISNSPELNTSRISRRKSWLERTKTSGKFDADSTPKCADRRSLIRAGSKVPEALSLSSPLCERNRHLKIESIPDDPGHRSIENFIKQSPRFFDILAEDSPSDVEIISSSSKVPETPPESTIIDNHEGLAVDSRGRNYLEADEDIEKSGRIDPRPFCFSPIKFRAESSDISDSLSIIWPPGKNKIGSCGSNAANSRVKSETTETSLGFVDSRKILESLQLSDTISVSSQLAANLVPESPSLANQSCTSPVLYTTPGVKSVNSCWIKAGNTPSRANLNVFAGRICTDRLREIRESAKLSKTSSERIDFDSNGPEDEIKIESDSDATISDFIENPVSQNFATVASKKLSRVVGSQRLEDQSSDIVERVRKSRDRSCDSDETHYSDGDSIPRFRDPEAYDPKNSQRISQTTSNSREGRVSANRSENFISQAASPAKNCNPERPTNVTVLNTTSNNTKKKKKGKKGSLVAKLQTIISSQVSNLRIWRYQMSRPDFTKSSDWCTLRIRERETRYGRHYLAASVIEDPNDLLERLFAEKCDSPSERSESSAKINTLTLMMIPEIIGVVKIRAGSALKIYPPLEIMDSARKILNVTFFNVIATDEVSVGNEVAAIREETRIIEDFECPCIEARKLVGSCPVKFTDTKPSVMRAMFGT